MLPAFRMAANLTVTGWQDMQRSEVWRKLVSSECLPLFFQANAACAALDKRHRAFGKMLKKWQKKGKELQVEVNSQKDCTQLKM